MIETATEPAIAESKERCLNLITLPAPAAAAAPRHAAATTCGSIAAGTRRGSAANRSHVTCALRAFRARARVAVELAAIDRARPGAGSRRSVTRARRIAWAPLARPI